jgi:hypothetical protein
MPPVVFVLSLQYLVLASIVLPLRLLRSISKIPESAKHSTARFAPFSSRHCFCPRCLQHEHLGIPPLNHPQSLRSESKQRSVRPVLHHPLAPFYSSYFPHLLTLSVSSSPLAFIPLSTASPHALRPRALPQHHHAFRHRNRAGMANQRTDESKPKQNSPPPSRSSSPPLRPPLRLRITRTSRKMSRSSPTL